MLARPKSLSIGIVLSSLLLSSAAAAQQIAITGATIIDGTGRPPVSDGVVLIRDGRLAAVGRSRDVAIPGGARRLTARGKYVIPGLMDAILILYAADPESHARYESRSHEIHLEAAQIALKNGLTTGFNHGDGLVKARDMINAGKAPGTRLYLGTGIIGFFPESEPPYLSLAREGRRLLFMTPEQVRPIIREHARKEHADLLKYGASGHWQGYESYISFSPRVQRVIVEEGHRAGLSVQAHVTTVESLDLAIDAGVDIVTHGDMSGPQTPIPEETLRKLVERRVAVSVLPVTQRNLEARDKLDGREWPWGKSPGDWSYFTQFLKVSKTNRRNMIKAGVTMLLATEQALMSSEWLAKSPTMAAGGVEPSLHGQLGEAHFNALLALEEEGMAPMEILKSATSNTARAHQLNDLGTLEPGKIADLVILDANPLESARNYRRIHAVIKDGKLIDRDALPLAPLITARATSN